MLTGNSARVIENADYRGRAKTASSLSSRAAALMLRKQRPQRYKTRMQELSEEEDFYYEGGLMVFTRRFHLRRGSCCGSGCRHCPYDPRWTKGATATAEEVDDGASKSHELLRTQRPATLR
jgi:hypothetical protein